MTTIRPLEPDLKETLHDACLGAYLDGECYAFAIALNRGLGYPMVGLMDSLVIRHALVREPDGTLRDARGRVPLAEVGLPFGIREPYELKDVTEADLRDMRPVDEDSIGWAARAAEEIWPELPWNGERKKFSAFVDELEALSRKHSIWIRGQYTTVLPVLCHAFGEETGYVITPTMSAYGYTLDRSLQS